jgi:glucose-6-phosphate isomerase
MTGLTQLPSWLTLQQHYSQITSVTMKQLFATDPLRANRFSIQACDLWLDYSKNRVTDETMLLLLTLAQESQLQEHIQMFFSGGISNFTEQRPALHYALRQPKPSLEIQAAFNNMSAFVKKLHERQLRGYSGLPITHVINIGIGGSDLGPRFCTEALAPYCQNLVEVRFISNVDGYDIWHTLSTLNPETTLFIIASKSFTTIETLTNANTARQWLCEHGATESELTQHFVAVTAKPALAIKFGVDPEHIFEFWDWVGGRYSLWSTIGLPIAIAIGMDNFLALLAGAHQMDEHFRTAPFSENLPIILALLSIWYINFFNVQSQAIIPYDQRLQLLPAYLQQLEMESNGKSVNRKGIFVDYATAPVIWGDIGTNGQHAFHQLLHQGTNLIPVDFLLAQKPAHPYTHHHQLLIANCLAQSEALLNGRTETEALVELKDTEEAQRLAKHKIIAGNKPSNTLIFPELSPKILGSLIALYEHKVFVEGIIWQVNSFDQYGVELGKKLAERITNTTDLSQFDSSTQQLIKKTILFN